jgi:PKD repeat protein
MVTHSYDAAGPYVPTLTVVDDSGATTVISRDVTVAENQPPEAQLTVTPSQPQPGENVTLNASGSTDPDGEIVEYRWDFDGDDSIDATRNESTVTHSYDAAGSYVPTLTVVDDSGATTATSRDVTVAEPLTCSVEPQEVVVGEQITVQAGGGGAVGEIEVDFQGDESYDDTTTDGTVTHRYESAGGYVVLARTDTTAGPEVVECGDVRVTENQPPVARLNVTPSQPRPGENVTLDASESSDPDGRIVEYRWDLDGDGTIDRTTNASSTTVEYTEDTQLDPAVTVIDDAGATGNASEPIQPFGARCTVDPRNVSVGDTVTIDASDSKAGFAAQFDIDGDGEYEYERDALSVQYAYNESGSYAPRVLVIGETREVLVDCPSIDVTVAENQPPVAQLNVTPSQPEPGENVTLDASESSDPDGRIVEYRWDLDGDGTIDRTTNASSTTVEYTEDTQLDPAVTVIDDAGATGNASQPVDTEDAGFGFPVDPEGAAGLLGLLGFGGVSYYLYASSAGVGAGGSGSKSRPPRPPKQLPESHGLAHIETGTVSTPIESGSVSVTGLGFEPDLILLSASNVTPEEGADPATDRTDGWAHGKVRRAEDGTLLQSTMTLADDDLNMDAGIGGANDGHALELLVHYDDPPERVLGSVTSTTTDGFEISFDTSGLRENHSEAEFTVLYKAFGFQGDPQVSVGHFRTPDVPGTQTIDLGINADHVVLFATNTIDDVDSYLMTDLPLGFSVGDVIGHGAEPAQLVRTATADPSVANSVAYAAYDDRALHLQYGYDGTIRGRTTATVTALAEGQMNLEYQKVYHGPNKLGSTDSKLVSYVAMNTGDVQPAIGHFRLPEPGSEEALAVELGFRPSMIEFQSFAIHEMNAEAVVDAPVSFGWSEGTVIADDNDIRHQVLDQTIGASMPPAAGPRIDPGFAASVRTVADGGKITGRDEVTVTRLTESGFEMVVTDVGTDSRTGGERRPLVFYKAWPQPIGSDSG